ANMMAGPGVCEAMAAAFTSATGTLAHRLVAALLAAEGRGGDARGQMSAALKVVEGTTYPDPWQGVLVDVRVDHHLDPLGELGRLVEIAEAYHLCDVAEEALVRGDVEGALAGSSTALALLPDEGNFFLGHIAALAALGRLDEATREAKALVARRPSWEGVLRALVTRGLLPLPEGVTVDRLLGEAP
ncbi:MAG: DUF1028 domain-containing protein, partial [Streptosporangiaceae bacterium]